MGIIVKDVCKAEFWCNSTLSLVEIFAKFRVGFPSQDNELIHDAENVWEWFEGVTADHRLAFNISRQHKDLDELGVETPIVAEPIRFSLSIIDPELRISEIGHRLASALRSDVHTGEVVYMKGDDFEYRAVETFRPD